MNPSWEVDMLKRGQLLCHLISAAGCPSLSLEICSASRQCRSLELNKTFKGQHLIQIFIELEFAIRSGVALTLIYYNTFLNVKEFKFTGGNIDKNVLC